MSEPAPPSPRGGEGRDNLRSLRILVANGGQLSALCKFGFSVRDGSFYVIPYGPSGRYHFGRYGFANSERTVTFDAAVAGEATEMPPHLSIHQSGQVHIRSQLGMAGPLRVPPLSDWTGEHIASVSPVRFDALAPFTREPKYSGRDRDFVFAVSAEGSGRLAVYANGHEPSFASTVSVHFTLVRPTLDKPLYIGVAAATNAPLGTDPGVAVIGGWDPKTALKSGADSFLYVNAG